MMTRPDGEIGRVAAMPMSAVPNVNDMAEFEISEGRVLLFVVSRRWMVEQNQDGGGASVRLQVMCTQLSLEENKSEDQSEA